MSYFYFQSKLHLLSYKKQNISLAAIISLIHFIFTGKKQYSLETFIKLNKNTLYVNFNKRKREYIITPIIPIGGVLLYLQQNNLAYHSTGKNITGKILIKEKYERYIIAQRRYANRLCSTSSCRCCLVQAQSNRY